MSLALLDNIVWHSLSGPHAHLASGTASARRYARGLGPLAGFADRERPDVDALSPWCDPGEHIYCSGWPGNAPAGWRVDAEVTAEQMVWNGDLPQDDGELRTLALGAGHVDAMLELVARTQPGPFGTRTIELGEYFGVFDGGALVAMAGERMAAGHLREISGVCTHPDAQGRGLARRLMHKLIRRQMLRGLTPFLHVMQFNTRALELYRRMGFHTHQQSVLRVLCRE